MKLHKSSSMWTAYVDLEKKIGSVDSTRAVYDRMLDLKIATPQTILNYASFLEGPFADYHARRGLHAKARDVFEEGLNAVSTPRDLALVFGAYARFERRQLAAELAAKEGGTQINSDGADFALARVDRLSNRKRELANRFLLRQNPHNVSLWHRQVKLFDGDPAMQLSTYAEALETVDPMKTAGKPHTLWVAFARMYESNNQLDRAEEVFERATQANYKFVGHLAAVWSEWAEMEVRNNNFEKAIQLMRQATAEPSVEVKARAAADGNEPVQMKLHKSSSMWTAYVDLEKKIGSVDSTRAVYDRMLDLKIATPQTILNYASFLEEHEYFEDSFKIYETGVELFKYQHVGEIWAVYLAKFVNRYGNTQLDRARGLFECAIKQTPPQEAKPLYLQYAKMEEDNDLLRLALHVYECAVKVVPDCEKLSIYEIYINLAESLGFEEVRKIYERAIEAGHDLKTLWVRLADREAGLGEIDRARRLYTYASKCADLRSDSNFWETWTDFELVHGNEDTFSQIKRQRLQ